MQNSPLTDTLDDMYLTVLDVLVGNLVVSDIVGLCRALCLVNLHEQKLIIHPHTRPVIHY